MENHIFKIHISSGNLNNICSIPQSEKRKTIKKKTYFSIFMKSSQGKWLTAWQCF